MSDEELMADLIDDEDLPSGTIEFRPERDDRNTRLDKYLADRLPAFSRTYLQDLIDAGHVRVDGFERRRTFKITPGQVVVVTVPEPEQHYLQPEPIPLSIVYEDADVLVIDKAAGMVVHPAPGHPSGTLANAVIAHAPNIKVGGSTRPGIVHRLDKDTSGLIVIAKSDRAHTSLVRQWNQRTVEKHYVTLVRGSVRDPTATIDVPIGRDPVMRNRMAAVPGGRPAVTHFDVRTRYEGATLLDVRIDTGRTHQIRVHLAFIGYPVVGDPVYNRFTGPFGGTGSIVKRHFLHAASLAIDLPGGERKQFVSPLPSDLEAALSRLEHEQAGIEE